MSFCVSCSKIGKLAGKESAGIPEEILLQHPDTTIRIPMLPVARSLNLSNSVAIILYEALRQQEFSGMLRTGELHHHTWAEAVKPSVQK